MKNPPKTKVEPNWKNCAPDMSDTMAMANKQMIYIFPLVTIFIARSMPAALSIYWIVTTVFGILQQIYVNKTIKKDPEVKEEVLEDAKEIEAEYGMKEDAPAKPAKKAKTDFVTKMMNKRLDKQEKKTGVEITIRKKQ
jgi:membrane protein insertase Oxa1/YidC/SpoIIIJ